MMKQRKFMRNIYGVSVMYDAVLFIVMVSISGAVLLPALQSNIAIESSLETHREEIVDETLLMLMTARADTFEYVFAGSQIENILGDLYAEDTLIYSITKTLLGKEQHHKTYVDLCVENLVSQFKVFTYRINIFTDDYDISLEKEMADLLEDYLGDKYGFNITVKWRPIMDVPFGGDLQIGPHPPETTYVASSYVSMPDTFFSTWWNQVEYFISDQLFLIEDDWTVFNETGNETGFRDALENLLNSTVNGILFDGFDVNDTHIPSILEKSVDYVFGKITNAIDSVFDEALNMTKESLDIFNINLSANLTEYLINEMTTLLGFENISSIDDAIDGLKTYLINETRNFLHEILEVHIENFIDIIMDGIDSIVDGEAMTDEITTFFTERIDILRAEFILTIWEVRG